MIKYIFFDLDGTLLDTYNGIRNSVNYALDFFEKPRHDDTFMKNYMGPPISYSFINFDGFNEHNVDAVVKKFRERYNTIGAFEYGFFEELKPVFDRLKEKGYNLCVATAKLEHIAKIILKDAGLDCYFDFIGGSDDNVGRREKTVIIKYVMDNCDITDSSQVLMVGDRSHDILGGKSNGVLTAGILCGYGSREELESCGADYIFENITGLSEIL